MGARKKNGEEAEVRNGSVRKEGDARHGDREKVSIYKKHTHSKGTIDKQARQGRMEGKWLRTLSFVGTKSRECPINPRSCDARRVRLKEELIYLHRYWNFYEATGSAPRT